MRKLFHLSLGMGNFEPVSLNFFRMSSTAVFANWGLIRVTTRSGAASTEKYKNREEGIEVRLVILQMSDILQLPYMRSSHFPVSTVVSRGAAKHRMKSDPTTRREFASTSELGERPRISTSLHLRTD